MSVVLALLGCLTIGYGITLKRHRSGTFFYIVWGALGVALVAAAWAVHVGVWDAMPSMLKIAIIVTLVALLCVLVVVGSFIFSQFNASNAFGIEHNGTGISNSIRLYCAGQTSTSPVPGGESLVSMGGSMVVGKWVSASVTSDNGLRDVTFYTNLVACGERHYTTSKALNKNCPRCL